MVMGELGAWVEPAILKGKMGGVKHARLGSFKMAAFARSMNEGGERRVVQ
ncbi:MAG TPA: hypothetical protein VEY93_03350 [Longimicrobium sp.]|nr:hypothetical protein [Longimicrobium sp.]